MKSTLCIEKQIFLDNPGMYLEIAAERPISIVEGARLLRLEEVVPATTEVSEHDKTICAALVMDSMVKDLAEKAACFFCWYVFPTNTTLRFPIQRTLQIPIYWVKPFGWFIQAG